MEPRVIRPSMKFVWFWYALAVLMFAAGVFAFNEVPWFEGKPAWLMGIPLVFLLVPIRKHIATRLIKLTLGEDRITLDRGLMSRYTRTIDVVKVQDVTVRQTLMQRMFGLGDLSYQGVVVVQDQGDAEVVEPAHGPKLDDGSGVLDGPVVHFPV